MNIILKSKINDYAPGHTGGDTPCELCGETNNYPYWRTFDQVSCFRGDDETNGNICHSCYDKAKLIFKLNRPLNIETLKIDLETLTKMNEERKENYKKSISNLK